MKNKPEESVLTDWWNKALNEGLRYKNADPEPELYESKAAPEAEPPIESTPYAIPVEEMKDSRLKGTRLVDARNAVTEIFGGLVGFADQTREDGLLDAVRTATLDKYGPDLNSYYNNEKVAFNSAKDKIMKEVVRERLSDEIKNIRIKQSC